MDYATLLSLPRVGKYATTSDGALVRVPDAAPTADRTRFNRRMTTCDVPSYELELAVKMLDERS